MTIETGKRRFISEPYGNSAEIEALAMRAYKGTEKSQGYRLCCYADYDDGMLYYCKCFDTYRAAFREMEMLSGGIWKEV